MALELPPGDRTGLDEHLSEPHAITARGLKRASAIEIRIRDLAGADEDLSQGVRIAADARERNLAVAEEHDAFVVPQRRRHTQRAGLPAQVEQLEDIVNPELAEWSLDRHQTATGRSLKMCCRSAAVRASRRARWAHSPSGSSSTTCCHREMASR